MVNQIIYWAETHAEYFRPFLDSVLAVPHVNEPGLLFNYGHYNFLANDILRANWWAILGTLIIAWVCGTHRGAIILTLQNRKARGKDRYESKSKTATTWASKNMFVLAYSFSYS